MKAVPLHVSRYSIPNDDGSKNEGTKVWILGEMEDSPNSAGREPALVPADYECFGDIKQYLNQDIEFTTTVKMKKDRYNNKVPTLYIKGIA